MALIPELVPKDKLLVANALNDTTHMIGNVVGLVVAGIIVNIAFIGAIGGFYIDSANLNSYDGYNVTDFAISYNDKTQNGTKWRIGADIDNLFDEHYSQAIWNGYGTNNYAVSAPRTFWLRLGIEI